METKARLIKPTSLVETSEIDKQHGYQFLFARRVLAIWNPWGREVNMRNVPDTCLDHLTLVTLLLEWLEQAGLQ